MNLAEQLAAVVPGAVYRPHGAEHKPAFVGPIQPLRYEPVRCGCRFGLDNGRTCSRCWGSCRVWVRA